MLMSDLKQRDGMALVARPERPGIVIDETFMLFRLPGSRTSLHAGHIPTIWVSYGDALRVECGPWSVTAQAVYVAPHCVHVVDGRGQLYQGLSLRGFRWPPAAEPRPVMALSPRALHLFVDYHHRQDASIARELAALLGFVPMHLSSAMSVLAERMHADPMHRLSQTVASALIGMERTAMLKQFRREAGMSFRAYKAWVGMQAALHVLGAGRPPSEAAMAGGFADLAHFSRHCRATTGYSPRQGLRYIERATAMLRVGQTRLASGDAPLALAADPLPHGMRQRGVSP